MSKLAILSFSILLLLMPVSNGGATPSVKWSDIESVRAHVKPSNSRIIGGDEVEPHSLPFQVGLRINGAAFCGGFLITSNYVVTAGHCGIVMRTVEVILGAHNITDDQEPGRVTIKGAEIIVHEGYEDDTLNNDITLVKLETSAELNEIIGVAKLAKREDSNRTYEGEVAIASGWGLAFDVPYPSTRDLSPLLQAVEVVVSDLDECVAFYYDFENNATNVRDTNVCTSGYKNKGTCNGDSGGPVTVDGLVVGITSFGTDLCETCAPSVYTRVSNYVDWIEKNSDYRQE